LTADKQRREDIFAETGLTFPEATLLNVVHYGMQDGPSELPDRATVKEYAWGEPATIEEYASALVSCLAKGWLQVIDDAAIQKISNELREGQILGPIYCLPRVGSVDFTSAGAQLWNSLVDCDPLRSRLVAQDVVHQRSVAFFPTRAAALAYMKEFRSDAATVSMSDPVPTGPWRVQWWRRFSDGFRIDIEEVGPGQGGRGDTWYWLSDPTWTVNTRLLQDILARHNVSLAEWLLLAATDNPHLRGWEPQIRPVKVSRWGEEIFGIPVPEQECQEGLDACLGNGWLRIVDRKAADEIQTLLQNDSALMPTFGERGDALGDVDFTPVGAVLYRMIATEYLGPDWEAGLFVSKELYRKQHRYSEVDEGLEQTVQAYQRDGAVVLSSSLVPIGPWCNHWWRQSPGGFRMELELGEP
jgi:hypothetical protein